MGRILKAVVIHIAIAMLIALVLPSSQPGSYRCHPPGQNSSTGLLVLPAEPTAPSSEWDYHNLIRPTYPPQDWRGNYLSPLSDQLASNHKEMEKPLMKRLEAARAEAQERMAQRNQPGWK